MKTWMKVVLCISLSLMFMFTSIGYAAITDNLRIRGNVTLDVPYGLFITNVTTKGTPQVSNNQVTFLEHTTTVDSIIKRGYGGASSVTYIVTVLNNTNLTYSYRDIYYQADLGGDYNGNAYVSKTSGNRKIRVQCSLENATSEEKKILPGKTKQFEVTYTFGSRMDANTNWRTLVNFQFGINVDGEREAIAIVEQKFLNILNTPSTYKQLVDVIDNKFDGRQEWTSNYIGNVKGSSSEDSMAVNTLFAGQLQIMVGNQNMDATVLIKHENLDGNTMTGDDYRAVNEDNGGVFNGYGCEMTLYLTIDKLEDAGAYVPVFAIVFTCDRDENGNQISEWYRIGSTYAGTANVVTYDGGNGTGSFVTDNWRADAADYKLIDGYSFDIDGDVYNLGEYSQKIPQGTTIKDIVKAKDARVISTFETLLTDAKRIVDNRSYAGMGIDLVEESLAKCSVYYTVDENGNYVVDPEYTVAKLTPAILDLYTVVNDALIKIDAIAKGQQVN